MARHATARRANHGGNSAPKPDQSGANLKTIRRCGALPSDARSIEGFAPHQLDDVTHLIGRVNIHPDSAGGDATTDDHACFGDVKIVVPLRRVSARRRLLPHARCADRAPKGASRSFLRFPRRRMAARAIEPHALSRSSGDAPSDLLLMRPGVCMPIVSLRRCCAYRTCRRSCTEHRRAEAPSASSVQAYSACSCRRR